MVKVLSFQEALVETAGQKRHLLLGNGFSIALFPDRFRYGSLLAETDFSDAPHVRKAFDLLATTDFEVVINALRNAVTLLPLYADDKKLAGRLSADAELLKELLVRAIASRHPERPAEIPEEKYQACRAFLAHFVGESRKSKPDLRGNIYTVNYDLLLYWTLLHDQIVQWSAKDPLQSVLQQTEELEHDDGFRAPDEEPDAPYVTWEAEGAADGQNVHFLHGGLHLFDYGAELQKKCWERSGGVPLIDQIREALDANKFPLFVSEGDSQGKLSRIRHSGYLLRSYKSFAKLSGNSSLFIFGHSLADNDNHILQKIEKGKVEKVFVGVYGPPDANRALIARAEKMAERRNEKYRMSLGFFDASSAAVWG